MTTKKNSSLYTMDVFIVGGPVKDAFIKQNPVISRTIEIRGDQTLENLHHEIFDAFEREEEHMYEFQIGGRGPNDPKSKRYDSFEDGDKKASKTTIESLKLKTKDVFGYCFDFGDEWWHQINVISVKKDVPIGNYPKVIKKVGESPPQYPDIEDK